MLYALNETNDKVKARPNTSAICPLCNSEVIPKCGQILVWHWAHKTKNDCDNKPETEWHLEWKNRYSPSQCEIVIENDYSEIRRADVYLDCHKTVIEFQHSSIPIDTMQQRQYFYISQGMKIVWVFDVSDCVNRISIRKRDRYCTFVWKHPRKFMKYADGSIFLDLGDGRILKVEKMYFDKKVSGWGYLIDKDTFVIKSIVGILGSDTKIIEKKSFNMPLYNMNNNLL